MRDWDDFAELVRASAKSGTIDAGLPVTIEELVSVGYEKWVGVQLPTGQRRTLESFEAVLKRLYNESIPSLYRKVKGTAAPRGNELERLLAAMLVGFDGEGSPHEIVERLAKALAELYLRRTPDIVDSTADAWLFASEGRLVHGPNDHTRDETFRELMSNRLNAAHAAAHGSELLALPLTLWAVDVTELWSSDAAPEKTFEIRRELMVLASALSKALASELNPPRETPTLEFSSKPTIFAPDIRIGLNTGSSAGKADLRSLLVRTSAICLIGHAPTKPRGTSLLQINADVDGNFFSKALMPATIIDRTRLVESGADRTEADRILDRMHMRQVCVGSKIPFNQVDEIRLASDKPADLNNLEQLALDPQFYVYSYDDPRPGEKSAVTEVLLHRFETPPGIRAALNVLLCGATAKLSARYASEKCGDGTIGHEMWKLLASQQVEILTVMEFLNFTNWCGIRPSDFDDSRNSGLEE